MGVIVDMIIMKKISAEMHVRLLPSFILMETGCYNMEILSILVALCEGNSLAFPADRATDASYWYFSLLLAWKAWLNIQVASDLLTWISFNHSMGK